VSRDDAPEEEAEPSPADDARDPERVIDAEADVDAADTEADVDAADTEAEVTALADAGTDSSGEQTDTTATDETADGDSVAESESTARMDTDDEGTASGAERDGRVRGYGAWTLLMLLLQLATTVGLVAVTARSVPGLDSPLVAPGVPLYVYVYAGLGAVGYTFTRAVTVDVTSERLADWTVRTFAALPLAAGTYLLASILLGDVPDGGLTQRQLAGLALVTGLFVNTAYCRLNGLATRLLGASG
jgi:hypothetical protein